jgi:hypothetical protein
MKWVEANDRCPLCRKFLATPEEFRQAARDTLGEDWVQDIILITRLNDNNVVIFFSYPPLGENRSEYSGHTEEDCSSAFSSPKEEDHESSGLEE